jgi:hypothetical protein
VDNNAKCAIILEQILQAAVEAAREAAKEGGDFAEGKQFAYYDLLSIAKEQAEIVDIDTSEIGMLDFDPDKELLGRKRQAA